MSRISLPSEELALFVKADIFLDSQNVFRDKFGFSSNAIFYKCPNQKK